MQKASVVDSCCGVLTMTKYSILVILEVVGVLAGSEQRSCRSMSGIHQTVEDFSLHSYGMCYRYLFFLTGRKIIVRNNEPVLILDLSTLDLLYLSQDYKNATSRAQICATLTKDECQQWISCCAAADTCCDRQRSLPVGRNGSCPRIWDGWSCFDDAEPGTKSHVNCPAFVPLSLPTRKSVKTCLNNGTWIQRTDYTPCTNFNELETSIFIGLGCSIVSISFLFPAIIILLSYKLLRKQHRIRLHVNFFLALLLKETMTTIWDMAVEYDKVKSQENVFDTVLIKNGVGCKILSFLKIYFKCCCYTWMFCEGFYLHRLMSNAFSPPRSIVYIYLAGWLLPLSTSTIYAILRGVLANESCWAVSYKHLEWIFDAPNIIFLVLNVVFLCNILRILVTQVQSHPNEPGTFRRAVKATLVLIPLFGVQLFVSLYRIPTTTQGGLEYERFSLFVNNLQGFFVALVFCFLNGEVLSYLRRSIRRRIRDRYSNSRRMNNTMNQTLSMRSECDGQHYSDTNSTLLPSKSSKKEYIQLDTHCNGKYLKPPTMNGSSRDSPSKHDKD